MDNNDLKPVDKEAPNFINAITELLTKHKHPRPEAWLPYLNKDAHNADADYQRFFINRAWRTILGSIDNVSTMEDRYCLVDSGDFSEWLKLFETRIISCILKNKLLFDPC